MSTPIRYSTIQGKSHRLTTPRWSWTILHGSLWLAANLIKPEAAQQMVVDDPGDLHERVDRRGADAPEPSAHQVLAHSLRFGRLGGHLASVAEAVCDGPVVHEAPAVVVERSEFTDYLQIVIGDSEDIICTARSCEIQGPILFEGNHWICFAAWILQVSKHSVWEMLSLAYSGGVRITSIRSENSSNSFVLL